MLHRFTVQTYLKHYGISKESLGVFFVSLIALPPTLAISVTGGEQDKLLFILIYNSVFQSGFLKL